MATNPSDRNSPEAETVVEDDSWERTAACQLEQLEHYAERRDVEASARRGCHLCSLALASQREDFREFWKKLDGQETAAYSFRPEQSATRRVLVEISAFRAAEALSRLDVCHSLRFDFNGCLGERREDWHREGSRAMLAYPEPPAHSIAELSSVGTGGVHAVAELSKSTDAEATFQLALWWLQKCLREHKSCAQIQKQSPGTFPERLMQVGDVETSKQWPHLVVRSDITNNRIAYLTLSHCWGGLQPLCLTLQNFESMRKGINPTDLPKTFRDAMIITRRLGFEYIWIDSLCIIQDSEEDWRTQSSTMGTIYRNSVCTIAALGAANGHQGCFVQRNPLKYRACFITTGPNNARYRIVEPSTDTRDEYIISGDTAAPLHKRAWVVQERLLSPRTLAYGSRSLYWDCLEGGEASEWWPEGGPDSSRMLTKSSMVELLRPPKSPLQRSRFLRAWMSLVAVYSACDLTFPKDKLVAIAGIVNQIRTNTGLTFVGGFVGGIPARMSAVEGQPFYSGAINHRVAVMVMGFYRWWRVMRPCCDVYAGVEG